MKPNLFRTIILPLLRRGLGGGVLLLPAVAFAQDLTVCAGKGYTLTSVADAVGASGGVTYTWYENGNPVENSNTATISIPNGQATAGTYYYSRKASNAECPDGVFSNTYTVAVYAIPTITTQPAATSTCAGGTVTLSVGANNATAYQWLDNTGAAVTGGQSATYTTDPLNEITTFSVVVSNTLAACSITSDPAVVTVNTPPAKPTSASANARCGSGTVTFSATAPSGCTIDWYTKATGGSTVSGGYDVTSFSPLITNSTTYHAQARNTTTGCVSAKRLAVGGTVNTPPAEPTDASANARCGSGTVTFSATVPVGCTIDWYTEATSGSIVSGGGGVTTFAPKLTGSTTYYAEALNITTGCVSATRLPVGGTVYDLPVVAKVSASTLCAGSTSKLTATVSSGATDAMTYTWNIGGSTSTTKVNTKTTQTLSANTTYTVTVKNSIGCTSAQKAGTITVTSGAASGEAPNACACATGLTECCGYCFNSCSSGGAAFTLCSGISEVSAMPYENCQTTDAYGIDAVCSGKGDGWRVPDIYEMWCLCDNREVLPGGFAGRWYWTSQTNGVTNTTIYFDATGCHSIGFTKNISHAVKCVK